ncbi:fatty acid desaturase [Magnetospira sp. QH-2]|uniref:fatty acid desaturase family protein n=1 Tax=Magnetospira sp. (strain QH-2) TaxID=1288970 RepID=UPI0005FA2592|nr:fatty acid desaturase [Magnetospira sp. QH-2]
MVSQKRSDAHTAIPIVANFCLAGLFTLVNLSLCLAVPLWLLPLDIAWGWLLIPLVLTTPAFWALIHECVHGVFHPNRTVNNGVGRFFGWQFGAPFRVLRQAHLIHHKVSRTAMDRPEVWNREGESWLARAINYYGNLIIGLYATEVSALVLCWIPQPWLGRVVRIIFRPRDEGSPDVRDWAVKQLVEDGRHWALRLDALIICVLYGLSFWLYGAYWPLLLAAILGRGFLISFLDNIYHYGTPLDQIRYSLNLSLPGWTSALILHFNHHRTHHLFPHVPWRGLPAIHAEKDRGYEQSYAFAALNQLKGPIAMETLQQP